MKREQHRLSKTRLYKIWTGMKARCSPASVGVTRRNYYKKGIRVCTEWDESFLAFYQWAIANGYKSDLTIDREDGNKGYTPDNCRWITQSENSRNKAGCSQYLGVGRSKSCGWYAIYKRKHLGYFSTEIGAAEAYDFAALAFGNPTNLELNFGRSDLN